MMSDRIKLHVYKRQRYYPTNRNDVWEHDEYLPLEQGETILDSDMLQVKVAQTTPAVELFIARYGESPEHKTLAQGEIFHIEDVGQNCSDYYVQYSFDISIAEGE